MKSYYNQEKISSSLRIFFQKIFFLSIPHLKSLSYIITGMISSESVVTSDISRKLKDDFSLFHVKHSDNKVHISFDHMFCKNKFTILLFSLRIGKQGIPLWFRCFKGKHNPDAYNLNLIKDGISYCKNLFSDKNYHIIFLADRWFPHIELLFHIESIGCF